MGLVCDDAIVNLSLLEMFNRGLFLIVPDRFSSNLLPSHGRKSVEKDDEIETEGSLLLCLEVGDICVFVVSYVKVDALEGEEVADFAKGRT